jgi:DNA-directed RNA polymerase specialized sigma subunit
MEDKKERKTARDVYMTHQEIADVLGVSRAAVSEMEKTALRKIKRALAKRGFTMEDFFGKDR